MFDSATYPFDSAHTSLTARRTSLTVVSCEAGEAATDETADSVDARSAISTALEDVAFINVCTRNPPHHARLCLCALLLLLTHFNQLHEKH